NQRIDTTLPKGRACAVLPRHLGFSQNSPCRLHARRRRALPKPFSGHLRPLAGLVLLEARRTRLPQIALLVALAGMGLAQFVAQTALTESDLVRISLLAALYRLTAVFILASFVIGTVQAEFADQGVQLALSLPITRAGFCAGKLAGFVACAV